MPTIFGHAFAAAALGSSFPSKITSRKFWLLGMGCAILPDADVLAFSIGIPYNHILGHRGFSHSILFALITGLVVTFLFFRKDLTPKRAFAYVLFFTVCTASHGILDALTSGGLGIAFFFPWDNTRYFMPWRPIKVSPLEMDHFISEWGKRVIYSELFWIGGPGLIWIILSRGVKKWAARTMKKDA